MLRIHIGQKTRQIGQLGPHATWPKKARPVEPGADRSPGRIGILLGRAELNGTRCSGSRCIDALAAYQRAHGHCRVPFSTTDDVRLAHWLVTQRIARRSGKLSAEQVRRLDELGFVWDILNERWERMLGALAKYKEVHGDCNVPAGWPPDPHLAAWVSKQRKCNTKGTLPSKRKKRLEALGFRFSDQGIVRKSKEKPRQSSGPTSGPIGSGMPPAPAKPSSLALIWRRIRQERSRRK